MNSDATWFDESWFGSDDWLQPQNQSGIDIETLFATATERSADPFPPQPQPQSQPQHPVAVYSHHQLQAQVQVQVAVDPGANFEKALTGQAKQREKFTREARNEMRNWMKEHWESPYLRKEEENYFCAKYGLTRRQVKTAFNNRRQRILAPLRVKRERRTAPKSPHESISFGTGLPSVDFGSSPFKGSE
jgi:hypothetical protein